MDLIIERGDTVRFIGKRSLWEITDTNSATHVEVVGCFHQRGTRADFRTILMDARRDRVELVRKGNKDADLIAIMDAHGVGMPTDVDKRLAAMDRAARKAVTTARVAS